jgi:hypothetical protein
MAPIIERIDLGCTCDPMQILIHLTAALLDKQQQQLLLRPQPLAPK